MKLTGQEIIVKMTNSGIKPCNIEYDIAELDLGETELVADEEFTNGAAWRVFFFKDYDVYIRQNGCYNSYESVAEYEDYDYDVVVPYEKTVTDYKKID